MTVMDLRIALSKFDDDLEVFRDDDEFGPQPVDRVIGKKRKVVTRDGLDGQPIYTLWDNDKFVPKSDRYVLRDQDVICIG